MKGAEVQQQVIRIRFWPSPPTPEFLSKDFCLQPGFEWKLLLRRTCCRGKNLLPLQFPGLSLPYEGKPGSLTEDSLLPQPESDGKSSDVGVGGRIGILN